MAQKEQIQEITDKLEEGIKNLFQSDNYKNYLKTLSKFTSYSFNNTLLIALQNPESSLVAGYGKWKEMGRFIRGGEKAIKILAPCFYKKEPDTENTDTEKSEKEKSAEEEPEEKVLRGFKVVNVFDISQTEGEPLPDIVHKLDGSVEGYADFIEALKQFSPVPIDFETIKGTANGYYSNTDKRIAVEKDMSESMHCKTGIHEIAHAILHDSDNGTEKKNNPDSRTKEVQAESIAFTVMYYFGFDTSEYSFGYILGWSSGKELPELKASMETIRTTSQNMITGIEEKLKGIQLNKSIQNPITKGNKISKDKPAKTRHRRH